MFWPQHYSRYFSLWCWIARYGIVRGFPTGIKNFGKIFIWEGSKTFQALIKKFFYTDNIDFLTHTLNDMQHIADPFATLCTVLGLKWDRQKQK